MKHIATLFLLSLMASGPAQADPIEGLWRTAPDDHGDIGYIRVGDCGTGYCGVLERADTAKARRRRKADTFCQFDILQPAILLQLAQDAAVCLVQSH